jgi:hypothetical protein
MGFMGAGGTVATVNGSGFTVTAPSRPTPPANGAAPNAPAPNAPAPAPANKTVKVTDSTTYSVTGPGSGADIATGMRITAFGQVGANNVITASTVTLAQAGLGPNGPANKPAPPNNGAAPNNGAPPAPPAGANTRPFTTGTVKSVSNSGGTYTVVVTSRLGDRTVIVNASTTVIKTTKGGLADVHVGDAVVVRGTHNADGSVTASAVQVVSSSLKGKGKGPFGYGPGFGFGGPRRGFGFGFGGGHKPPANAPAPVNPPVPAV